jgi:hypothetical protein
MITALPLPPSFCRAGHFWGIIALFVLPLLFETGKACYSSLSLSEYSALQLDIVVELSVLLVMLIRMLTTSWD